MCWQSRVRPVPGGPHGGAAHPEGPGGRADGPPFSRKSRTAAAFSMDRADGLPPVLPSAAARSTPARIRSRMVPLSHSAKDSNMWSTARTVGRITSPFPAASCGCARSRTPPAHRAVRRFHTMRPTERQGRHGGPPSRRRQHSLRRAAPTIRSPSINRNSWFRSVGASPTMMGLS